MIARAGGGMLDWSTVLRIRAAKGTLRQIARVFGVHYCTVYRIRAGKSYRDPHRVAIDLADLGLRRSSRQVRCQCCGERAYYLTLDGTCLECCVNRLEREGKVTVYDEHERARHSEVADQPRSAEREPPGHASIGGGDSQQLADPSQAAKSDGQQGRRNPGKLSKRA